jgi:hypothetical protein
MPEGRRTELARMRGAHNLWYVYAKPAKANTVREALKKQVEKEPVGSYDFEAVLDECGYRHLQKLENPAAPEPMWQAQISKI